MAAYTGTRIDDGEPDLSQPHAVYDNNVTVGYKWSQELRVPINFLILRPSTPQDRDTKYIFKGTVFESLPMIIDRLYRIGETPRSVYDIIQEYTTYITDDDIIFTYYELFNSYTNGISSTPYYILLNTIYIQMGGGDIVPYEGDKKRDGYDNDRFSNEGHFLVDYGSWRHALEERMIHDTTKLETIIRIQRQLNETDKKTEKLDISPVTINSTIMAFNPLIEGRNVIPDDGLDIFNDAEVSKYIPFIRYNDKHGKTKTRIYTGGKVEYEPNYSITIIPFSESNDTNTIYMTLWLGDPNSDGKAELRDASRESFFTIIYHLTTNRLTIGTPVNANPRKGLIPRAEIAYQRAQTALPKLVFGAGNQVKVRGEFDIYNIEFDETSFLHMVLLYDLMNVYLYMEENVKPFALKKRLDIHYRSIYTDMNEGADYTAEAYISNSAAISMTLTQKVTEAPENVTLENGTKARLPGDFSYIHINISHADSKLVIDEFLPIFKLIMQYYADARVNVLAEYVGGYYIGNRYVGVTGEMIDGVYVESTLLRGAVEAVSMIPEYLAEEKRKTKQVPNGISELTRRQAVPREHDANIRSLQEQAPELFVLRYARKCQSQYQPKIIGPDEIEMWKQRRIEGNERQIMPFPKDNPRWYFVCPDDNHPYPGVKVNRNLSNADKYPYIPCCFAKDHMSPDKNSNYRAYIEDRPPREQGAAKAENPISTNKIIDPGRTGFLPHNIRDIVKRYSEDSGDMLRYGVIHGTTNSLLHCICTALDDQTYLSLTDSMKEGYISKMRQYIAANIHPGLLRQELYDYTDEEILAYVRDNTKFLDPGLFYRAIEEIFKINIYVFTLSDDQGTVDIPRHKIFHSHILRKQRRSVLIMKSMGSESNALIYPQCELIVDSTNDQKIFGLGMTEICNRTLSESLTVKTWTITDTISECRADIYSRIDYLQLFKISPVSQFIDSNGKMRAITLSFKMSNSQERQLFTIATLPSQPENLPSSTTIHRVDFNIITRIIQDQPTAITRNDVGDIDGYWIRILDIQHGIYIPIVPTQSFPTLEMGPPNPLLSEGPNITTRLQKLRRTLNIIIQIIKWLYDLALVLEKISPSEFRDKYMIVDTRQITDSANYYDLTNIPRRFPNIDTIQKAIDFYESQGSNLFQNRKIVMYDKVFMERIIRTLTDYANLQEGLRTEIKPKTKFEAHPIMFIDNFYETEGDFRVVPNSKLFTSQSDLDAWSLSLKAYQYYGKYFNIRHTIDPASVYLLEPYIYQHEDGKIYIIQNVAGGSKTQALYLGNEWFKDHINYGYNGGRDLEDRPVDTPHMIYGISSGHTLVPIQDNTGQSLAFINIVYYGSKDELEAGKDAKYAGMLEIL